MHNITPGQRWISDTELDLGLGIVLAVEHRTIHIAFPAAGEERMYARQTAPLTRVAFVPGDSIENQQNETLQVDSVEVLEGLLFYCGINNGKDAVWPEGQLSHHIQLNRPRERLLAAQIDANKWFELRYQTLQHINRMAHSDLYGLIGVRTSLIPHQLFIAHEVAKRYAPRVLLADEVGLGKTIEAGLILHQQLLTERAKRVLIVVPEALVHQWLVEMLRRFNLHFSVFDEERCIGIEENNSGEATRENPFQTEQLILCSLDFLCENRTRSEQALDGEWDFLVVDEAHHLQWSPTHISEEYQIIEALAEKTKGVLLLTATPEQLGKESHFARLRLLDPDRFPDFESFVQEEANYQPIASAVEELLKPNNNSISEQTIHTLRETLSKEKNQLLIGSLVSDDEKNVKENKQQLIDRLLDRHGTGRVLFRNTRATVKGFPKRQLNAYPLSVPDQYAKAYKSFVGNNTEPTLSQVKKLICPEQLILKTPGDEDWSTFDPRIDWLIDRLTELKPEKVLVITASQKSAIDIAQSIKTKTGMHMPVFHEQLSIIERDRAAAYFADNEYGGQVLICSEIGSEGRNFQFSHHLVLFDLPLNPDLLEQRIGRLDRIGQTHTIQIHVPYFMDSPQSLLFDWYQHGLASFEKSNSAAASVFEQIKESLLTAISTPDISALDSSEAHQALINGTKKLSESLNEQLHKGRDSLLEYNSCVPMIAHDLQERAIRENANSCVEDYLNNVFDCFGVDTEIHSTDCYIVKPGEHMHTHFPGLEEDGMKVTFNRELALSNEDMQYISWEHPIAGGALDLVSSNETGNTALVAIKHPNLSAGTMYLECVFVLEPVAQKNLQSKRYLPPTTIHLVTDQQGNNINNTLRHELINQLMIPIEDSTAKDVVRSQTREIKSMVDLCEKLANEKKPLLIAKAHQQAITTIETEIERLQALKEHNPNVREEEIQFFEAQRDAIHLALETATVRLDAVRVIVAT